MNPNPTNPPANILIVDDQPANLSILSDALEPEGYRILAAPSGEVALDIARRVLPDLILLDVLMPGMDGFETCRQLKNEESTREIPVIFVTAKDETESVVEGFRVGGVDYIPKPFEKEEALARVETHLKIHRLTRELIHKNEALEQEIVRRTQAEQARDRAQQALVEQNERLEEQNRALEEANRQIQEASRAKSAFLASMSHELRTPMNSILGFTELIEEGIFGEIPEVLQEPVEEIHQSGQHLLNLINDVLDLSKIEAGRMDLHPSECVLEGCIESVAAMIRPLAEDKGLRVLTNIEEGLPTCVVDEGRIMQVLLNLGGNAVKFTEKGEVELGVRKEEEELFVWVRDTGIGIPSEKLEEIFTEFSQAGTLIAREQEGTGLGLSISKRIVELHGGEIGVESEVGKGSTFWFRIPLV